MHQNKITILLIDKIPKRSQSWPFFNRAIVPSCYVFVIDTSQICFNNCEQRVNDNSINYYDLIHNLDLKPLFRGHWSKFGECLALFFASDKWLIFRDYFIRVFFIISMFLSNKGPTLETSDFASILVVHCPCSKQLFFIVLQYI